MHPWAPRQLQLHAAGNPADHGPKTTSMRPLGMFAPRKNARMSLYLPHATEGFQELTPLQQERLHAVHAHTRERHANPTLVQGWKSHTHARTRHSLTAG